MIYESVRVLSKISYGETLISIKEKISLFKTYSHWISCLQLDDSIQSRSGDGSQMMVNYLSFIQSCLGTSHRKSLPFAGDVIGRN
ncbi:hypothetical protein C5167_018421 [Papaver somniferum]|uniref:Uncharacterized protein n=1 Tax=Papaver somniferum TaxID=3469 RepID=A0A4Y7IR89_PAPSO|nr:hypothetical protein C5167_018421 [Papaver somniferum]